MAKRVIKTAYLALGGTEYSSQFDSIELSLEADEVDATTFGSGGVKEFLQGLRSAKLTANAKMDADLSGLDAAIYAVYNHASANTMTFEVRAENTTVGATNPKWTGSVLITQYGPMVKLGEIHGRSFSFTVTGAVTRAAA